MLRSVQLNERGCHEPSVRVLGTWGRVEQLFSCGSGPTVLAQRVTHWISNKQTTSSFGFSLRSLLSPTCPDCPFDLQNQPLRLTASLYKFGGVKYLGGILRRPFPQSPPLNYRDMYSLFIHLKTVLPREVGHREFPPLP